jgi:hypothetical protein
LLVSPPTKTKEKCVSTNYFMFFPFSKACLSTSLCFYRTLFLKNGETSYSLATILHRYHS